MNLSTNELAQLQSDQSDYFPDTCTLQTVALTSDGMGGHTEAWSDTHAGIACRLSALKTAQGEQVEAGQITTFSRWVLSVAHGQTIDETMRVVHDGETYEIEHLEDTHSNRTARRAHLRRLD
jgi:SPP1 family predicted phage head-tail adaptor